MRLFTKDIDKKLFAQYALGADLEKQMVVAKIFNPYGFGCWYLLNSDPQDPDYLWAIVDLFEVETGSVSRSELESVKVPPFGLGLERDLYFTPVNAKVLYNQLLNGKRYAKGGMTPNYYEGKSSEEVWNNLSEVQRQHFLYDHADQIENYRGTGELTSKEIRDAYNSSYKDLDKNIKNRFDNHVREGSYAKGGSTQEGIDLFEEPENIPSQVQNILDKYEDAFLDENYKGLESAKKDLEKIGYTFEYYLDGQAYDLRPIGTKGRSEEDEYAKGGEMDNGNLEMLRSNNKAIRHHTEELENELKGKPNIEAWVVAKGERAATDLSDITHYLDGKSKKMADGGEIEWGADLGNGITVGTDVYITDPKSLFRGKTGFISGAMGKDYMVTIMEDGDERNVIVSKNGFDKLDAPEMAMGGKTTFNDKVKAVKATLLKNKKVSPKVQKDYGKTYSPKEALESAKRIVGSRMAKYEK